MNSSYRKIGRNCKERIQSRLDRENTPVDDGTPVLRGGNTCYELSGRERGVNCGGIGAIHEMVRKLKLPEELDKRLNLLKRHLPYHESDHVLNLAYNAMLDGQRLQDIELRRNDEAFLDALGAQRIPDPTTAGDFTRRFDVPSMIGLMDAINASRQRVWKTQPRNFLSHAFVDVDGTIAATTGECKGGMSLSYKGIWGYAPLVVSLANTSEPLFLVNRSGNVSSNHECVPWINRAIDLVTPHAKEITLRGDTDFSLSEHLDEWDQRGIHFIFGFDANTKLCKLADDLSPEEWKEFERMPKYEIKTRERRKPDRVKERVVVEKEYQNQILVGESIAEIEYQPVKCDKAYRMVILRKNITVKKGDEPLFDEIRYFFYITNHKTKRYDKEEIVGLANQRCNQENVIEQLKNGVNAMQMPVDDLMSNWAYMVMCALAWNLKAWFGMLMPNRERGMEVVRMEFRRFLHSLMMLPSQIVKTGRRIVFRILTYNEWIEDFFETWTKLKQLRT